MTTTSDRSWTDPELTWLELTETAFSEWKSGEARAAEEPCQRAYRLARGFGDCDPRQACSVNNLAIALRLRGAFTAAEQLYRRATQAWHAASDWIGRMRLEPRARSSLFHLRMERKHRDQYDEVARGKYRKLLPAGHAATLNNLAELCHADARLGDAETMYRQALEERLRSMGPDEAGVAKIRRNFEWLRGGSARGTDPRYGADPEGRAAEPFGTQAERNRWIVDIPPEFTDEGRLMAAILLTRLVDHQTMCRRSRE